jgi:hypothetical protein
MNLLKNSPYFISTLILLNPILNQFGVFYFHYLAVILFSILLIFKPPMDNGCRNKNDFFLLLFFVLIILMILGNIIASISSILFIANSLMYFLFIPLFWILYKKRFEINIIDCYKVIVYIALLNGIIALLQFFVNPNIFNLYDYSLYQLEGSSIGFRPGALFGSPQVYGLFVALASIVSFEINSIKKENFYYMIGFALIPLALLSGNKSVLLSLIIYILFKLFYPFKLYKMLSLRVIVPLILIISGVFYLSKSNTIIDSNINRVFEIFSDENKVLKLEEEGRLTIYSDFLNTFDSFFELITGEGIGSTSSKARSNIGNRGATESFILSVLVEYGIILLVTYIILWIKVLSKSFKAKSMQSIFIINFVLFLSLFIVHAFAHPIYFVFWPIILYPLFNKTLYTKTKI